MSIKTKLIIGLGVALAPWSLAMPASAQGLLRLSHFRLGVRIGRVHESRNGRDIRNRFVKHLQRFCHQCRG